MQTPNRIVGAGLSGLLAAYAFPGIPIVECAAGPIESHKAVLRFRSDAVSRLTGIPFRPVTVRKGMWSSGQFRSPDIALANAYSRKVLGGLYADRSIWNVASAVRYVAPETFYEQLVEHAGSRIVWGAPDNFGNGPLISTAPLSALAGLLDESLPALKRAPIYVTRYRVPNCEVFETVYFPHPKSALYRASITGDLLIIETVEAGDLSAPDQDAIRLAFGVDLHDCAVLGSTEQPFGKIVPLPDDDRKRILFKLTHNHAIYSLGRFSQWRNILLDDVVSDLDVIKRLLNSAGSYEAARARAK